MGIPILQEIYDGIRWLIGQFLYKMPKPLSILIFLLFLLLFGNLINLFFEMGGVHCNQDKRVVKTDSVDVYNNFRIILAKTDQPAVGTNLTFDEMFPNEPNIAEDCYIMGRNDTDYNASSGFWSFLDADDFWAGFEACDLNNLSEDCRPYLINADQRNCTSMRVQDETPLGREVYEHICVDDAYYRKFFIEISELKVACNIPQGYKWEFDDGRFYCINNEICGENVTTNYRYQTLLEESGAELMYEEDRNEGSINQIIYFRCDNNLNARVTLFGLDVFNYQYWVLLIVIYVMMMGIVWLYQMK